MSRAGILQGTSYIVENKYTEETRSRDAKTGTWKPFYNENTSENKT